MDALMEEAMESLERIDAALADTTIELAVWLDMLTKAVRWLAEGDPEAAREMLAVIEEERDE